MLCVRTGPASELDAQAVGDVVGSIRERLVEGSIPVLGTDVLLDPLRSERRLLLIPDGGVILPCGQEVLLVCPEGEPIVLGGDLSELLLHTETEPRVLVLPDQPLLHGLTVGEFLLLHDPLGFPLPLGQVLLVLSLDLLGRKATHGGLQARKCPGQLL